MEDENKRSLKANLSVPPKPIGTFGAPSGSSAAAEADRRKYLHEIMRNFKPEVVFVFGAGASMPTLVGQHELVERLVKAPGSARLHPAKLYLQCTFPGLTFPNSALRFEDIVGPLEIVEADEYWFHFSGRSSGSGDLVTNKDILDSLDTWVATVLDPDSIPKPPGKKDKDFFNRKKQFVEFYAPNPNATLCYSRLVHLLGEGRLASRAAFLSMNYDILLDRVLFASSEYTPEYGIDAFYEVPESYPHKEVRVAIPILKLHGSLNWRVCENCHILRNLQSFVTWPKSSCVDCGRRTARPMLIRPTLLKDFRHRLWKDVWRAAGHILANSRRWFFIGYSLPMADVWMLRLLAQSLRSGGIKPAERKVTVVNLERKVRNRFSLLFPTMDFQPISFEEWLSNCTKSGGLL